MYVEKQQARIIFRARENQKGLTINIATGEVVSLSSGKPYSQQFDNHIQKLLGNYEQLPDVFRDHYGSILHYDEATAIVGLYYNLSSRQRQAFPLHVTVMQMFYNRQFAITFRRVVIVSEILAENHRFNRTNLVNFIIENEIHEFDKNLLAERFSNFINNIDMTDFTNEQRRFVRSMLEDNMDREKIEYIIRKMKTEHIEMVVGTGQLEDYFHLCNLLEESYNQRNFLNSYANMLYYRSIHKDELAQKKIRLVQRDIFKLDSEKYYCVMPTTAKQFIDMGNTMRNCIGGYYDAVARGACVVVFVYDRATDRPIINIQLEKRGNQGYTICQFAGLQNNRNVENVHRDFYNTYRAHLMNIQE